MNSNENQFWNLVHRPKIVFWGENNESSLNIQRIGDPKNKEGKINLFAAI